MTSPVTVHDVAEQTVVSIREQVPDAMLADFFDVSVDRLLEAIKAARAVRRGSPFATYHGFAGSLSDVELAVPVAGRPVTQPPVVCRAIPAMRVARIEHHGLASELVDAYAELEAWIPRHGYHSTGPVREHPHTRGDASERENWTAVEIPIAPSLISVHA